MYNILGMRKLVLQKFVLCFFPTFRLRIINAANMMVCASMYEMKMYANFTLIEIIFVRCA